MMSKIKAVENETISETITKKAAALFREKGYKATSMRELAESIGVEAPSLYNHIGNKAELLQNICFKIADDFQQQLIVIEASHQTAVQKIEQLIRFHIKMMLQHFDEVYVADHEWKHLPAPHLGIFLNQRKIYEGLLVQLIKEGVKNNEMKNIHPHVAALTILFAVRGLEFWQRHQKEISATALEENIVNHLLNGLIN